MLELNKIYNMDCLEGMKQIDDNSIDAIVTDPPYGLGFMGKEWDTFDETQNHNLTKEVYKLSGFTHLPRYRTECLYNFTLKWANECLRVLKPGGHLLSFAGARTYHKIASAIDDAGFEIRDQIMWVYGSGFPKSYNISKGIDKYLKKGDASWNGTGDSSKGALGYSKLQYKQGYRPADYSYRHNTIYEITEAKAKEWEGWGTALKPAHEPIVVARKPLSEKNVALNVLKWRTGGLNIDGCRIPVKNENEVENGRFPANMIFDEEAGKMLDAQSGLTGQRGIVKGTEPSHSKKNLIYNDYSMVPGKYAEPKDSLGGASRFFYCAKASRTERELGLDDLKKDTERKNIHPTVKPIKLIRYLVRLVTPKGGVVLDPFIGSGTTAIASYLEGFNYIGFEKEKDYVDIANNRIKYWSKQKRIV